MTKVPWFLAHATPRESEPYLQRQVERRLVDQSLLAVVGVKLPWLSAGAGGTEGPRTDQAIGEACGGQMVARCREFYGGDEAQLATACWSCPGLKEEPPCS